MSGEDNKQLVARLLKCAKTSTISSSPTRCSIPTSSITTSQKGALSPVIRIAPPRVSRPFTVCCCRAFRCHDGDQRATRRM